MPALLKGRQGWMMSWRRGVPRGSGIKTSKDQLMPLLDRFALVTASGPDGAERALRRLFGSCDLGVSRADRSRLRATINFCARGRLGLMYGSYGAPVSAALQPCNAFVQGIPLTGYGEQAMGRLNAAISPSNGVIVSPGDDVRLRYSGEFDHLVLVMKPAAVLDKLSALLGDRPAGPLAMSKTVDYNQPGAAAQRRLVNFLAQELTRAELPIPVIEEIEQAIIVSFLVSNANNFSAVLSLDPKLCAPSQVRMAEEFIEANWAGAITIEMLAAVTNTSARSLFRAFKAARGYSPMAMVRTVRLRRARRMLADPETSASVTEIAFACGFGNLGHFSSDYFRSFGELPSDTRRGARNS
jgi:AraC-like DNA-binding protein